MSKGIFPAPLLLLLSCVGAAPRERDEVLRGFPDPIPADRAWELAQAYCLKVAAALRNHEYAEAQRWYRSFRDSLGQPYRDRFNHDAPEVLRLRHVPLQGGDHANELFARYSISIGAWEGVDLNALRKRNENDESWKDTCSRLEVAIAWCLCCAGRTDEALELLEAIERRYGPLFAAKQVRDAVVETRGREDDAEVVFKIAEKALPHHARSWGPAYLLLGRVKRALDRETVPARRVRWFQAALDVLLRIGDPAGAAAWQDRLIDEPGVDGEILASTLLERANAEHAAKNLPGALARYRRIADSWPRSRAAPKALFNLGYVQQQQGIHLLARESYRLLLARDVNNQEAASNVMSPFQNYHHRAAVGTAECFEREGDWGNALQAWKDSLWKYHLASWCGSCREGSTHEILDRIEDCCRRLGNDAHILEFYLEVLAGRQSKFGGSGGVPGRALKAARQLGQLESLRMKLEEALKADPTLDLAKQTLEYLKQSPP